MIRFVDLTEAYWIGEDSPGREGRCCAFVDTVTDTFVMSADGDHVFDDLESFPKNATGDRCRALIPPDFFD